MHDKVNLEKLLQTLNKHVPSKRSFLSDMLNEKNPGYVGKDGNHYHFKREELETIANLLDERERGKLRLPIYIASDTSYSGGAWKVRGNLEVKVISHLIDREPEFEDEMRLFFPHLSDLRVILPTTTTVLFLP